MVTIQCRKRPPTLSQQVTVKGPEDLRLPQPDVPRETPPTLRLGTRADLAFCDHLQTKYKGHLGYFYRQALEAYLDRHRVFITEENADAAGYILTAERLACAPEIRPIFQAAVAMDAMRRHHGLTLVKHIIEATANAGQTIVQANCAAELEANSFWEAAGFKAVYAQTPETKAGRLIITWRYSINAEIPSTFYTPPSRAGHRARRTYASLAPLNILPVRTAEEIETAEKARRAKTGVIRVQQGSRSPFCRSRT